MAKNVQSAVQSILNLRQKREEAQAIVLKSSKASLASEEEKLKGMEDKKSSVLTRSDAKDDAIVTLSINQLQVLTDYKSQLNVMIVNQIGEVDKVNKQVETDRAKLINASKEKKVVEKLRDRRLLEESKIRRRKEEKVESEIAIRVNAGKTRISDQ